MLLPKRLFDQFNIIVLSLSLSIAGLSACNEAGSANGSNDSDSLDEAQKHLPENALKSLEVAAGLVVNPVATEPVLKNPTNIDVDERGRIWVTEAYNYRPEINGNPVNEKGDRILILQDTDSDGVADSSKVFYQGPEINAPLGVCVLGNKVLVSQSPYVWAFYDDNGDDSADRKEIMFQGIGGEQHDHGMHTFIFGPDGKLYFNFGNEGTTLKDKNGRVVRDQDGDEIGPKKYQQGMVFRCNPDGSQVECLGHNFRNNYELSVDSYGTIWQSDNDDDGNRGVRINYVMDYGNYGYRDEMTGASWQSNRTNMEDSIMQRHWHLNDPGVVPNLLQTGAGSPTGMVFYEGTLLPEAFRNQVIHADPGVNVVRAYPVTKSGAGYTASMVNLLDGKKDQWFRPSDICVAPDGSLIVADWYDPGVGGHQAGDQQRGRIYRIAPENSTYKITKQDYSNPAGAIAALQNPNLAVRHHAWTTIQGMGNSAVPELEKLWRSKADPRMRARAFWALAKLPGGAKYIHEAAGDPLPELRMAALRAARQDRKEIIPIVTRLAADNDPQIRRECIISLSHVREPQAAKLWAGLAAKHDGKDRWYLEALGIGADGQWDAFFGEYLALVPDPLQNAAGRDIVWRARTDKAVQLLSKLAADNQTDLKSRLRYFRAFDFNKGAAKSQYLLKMIEEQYGKDSAFTKLVLQHLDPRTVMSSSVARKALTDVLKSVEGTREYVELVKRYEYASAAPQLLSMIRTGEDESLSAAAAALLLEFRKTDLIRQVLSSNDTAAADNMMQALGRVGSKASIDLLQQIALSSSYNMNTRMKAAQSMGRSMSGEDRVLELLADKKLNDKLIPPAVEGLKGAWRKAVYTKATGYLPGKQQAAADVAEPQLNELVALRGSVENGKKVFQSTCSLCHQVNNEGQNFGPNLSEIGAKLPREGLLDAIVHPSAGISFGYETWLINMKDGSTYTGIISSKTESDIDLKMPGGTTQKIKTSDVSKTTKLNESMMPAMHQSMDKQQLADLLEYLASLKKKA